MMLKKKKQGNLLLLVGILLVVPFVSVLLNELNLLQYDSTTFLLVIYLCVFLSSAVAWFVGHSRIILMIAHLAVVGIISNILHLMHVRDTVAVSWIFIAIGTIYVLSCLFQKNREYRSVTFGIGILIIAFAAYGLMSMIAMHEVYWYIHPTLLLAGVGYVALAAFLDSMMFYWQSRVVYALAMVIIGFSLFFIIVDNDVTQWLMTVFGLTYIDALGWSVIGLGGSYGIVSGILASLESVGLLSAGTYKKIFLSAGVLLVPFSFMIMSLSGHRPLYELLTLLISAFVMAYSVLHRVKALFLISTAFLLVMIIMVGIEYFYDTFGGMVLFIFFGLFLMFSGVVTRKMYKLYF